MGEDEAGTARLVRERREAATPIVRSCGGRLVKTTGDGVLLEFPLVVAAVECAIAIQKMMAERNAALPENVGGQDRGEPAGGGHCSGTPALRRPSIMRSSPVWYVGSSLLAVRPRAQPDLRAKAP